MDLADLLTVLAPAAFGLIGAAAFGHREVARLRELTGDDSLTTRVLSGDIFRIRRTQAGCATPSRPSRS